MMEKRHDMHDNRNEMFRLNCNLEGYKNAVLYLF